jgi:hypothetical protein
MGRQGSQAVETREPNELYDSLSQEAKDSWDEIGKIGFKPEKGLKGLWFARRPGEPIENAVGPAHSLGVLHSLVKATVPPAIDDDPIDLESLPKSNGNGRVKQPYLPGAEDIAELDDQADICLQAQDDQELAKSNFSEAKDEMKKLMQAHGRTNYKRGGWNMTIKNKEILELKQDKNRSVKKVEEVDTVIDPAD